jgi:hypothetical protein
MARKIIMYPTFKSTKENSFGWRIWHSVNYMMGGVLFFFGSLVYLPCITDPKVDNVLGGWLFTIGSANFLIADLTEFTHFRKGFIGRLDETLLKGRQEITPFRGAELGINFIVSALGSFLYLIGSIFFIPATQMLAWGEWIFIIGSAVIFLSQSWKCYRTLCIDDFDDSDHSFKLSNLWNDFPGFNVDLHAGIGGLMYLLGTWFFREVGENDDPTFAVGWFIAGGSFFSISGIFMQYRYYMAPKEIQPAKEDLDYMMLGN